MEITARITADAKVNALKDGRQVVNFTVALNDSYKAKGNENLTKVTQYVNCSYWQHPGIAQYLTKGSLVELFGRIGVNAWQNAEGEPKANLTLHVNNIKLHGGNKANGEAARVNNKAAVPAKDDLPF